MTQNIIQDNNCWICGGSKNLTNHHCLPQHLKPKNNVQVPICRPCHDKIHYDDLNGMFSYIHKITKIMEDNSKNIKKLNEIVAENNRRKEELEKLMQGKKVKL